LVSRKAVSLTDLGVTPQTVFISPRTVGVNAKADLKRLRPLLGEVSSRRTSLASRSNRGTVDNPVDELRKRLATLDPLTKTPDRSRQTSEQPVSATEQAPSESAISSTLDLSAMTHTGRKKVDTKGAPAVAAVHTNAIGTTTIHDEPVSGRSTPTLGTAIAGGNVYASSYEGQDPGVRAFLEQVDLENYREPLLDFGPRVLASHRKRAPRPKTSNNPQGVTLIGHLTHHTDAVVSIVASPDQVYFATASQDGTVLIWDSAKLERSIACEPRRSYTMDSPITAMCRIENTHCLAVASEDGQLHVLRVHVATTGGSAKYGKVECIRKWHTTGRDGHVTFIAHLHGKSNPYTTGADIRIFTTAVYQYVHYRSIGYTHYGDYSSLPTSTRTRRHFRHLSDDSLVHCRYYDRHAEHLGPPLWSHRKIMEGQWSNHSTTPPSCQRKKLVVDGIDCSR
jgi:phosphoinositide-3-kinase regulatory subunit 4